MPDVPVYGGRQVKPQGLPNLRERSESINLGGISQGITAVRDTYLQVAAQEAARADEIAVQGAETKLSQWINDRLFNPETGVIKTRGKNTFGLSPELVPEFEKYADEVGATMTSDRQKRAYQSIRDTRRLNFQEILDKHEASEREKFYDDETNATILDSVNSAGNFFNDPKLIQQELHRQEKALRQMGIRKGWSEQELVTEIQSNRSNTHLEVLDRMIALRQDGKARNYLNEVRDQMDGDDVTTVERALQTNREISKSEVRARLADYEAAARYGVATSPPSRSSLVAAFGEAEGNRLANEVDQLTVMSRDVAEMHNKSGIELLELVGSYQPVEQEGAAGRAQQAAFMESSIRSILTAREKDPASYMIGESPQVEAAWKSLANGEEGASDKYMQAFQVERERLGIFNDNPLPSSYADQLVADIIKPKDNETLYGSINREAERWGPKHWPQVYGQIATKLPDSAAIIGSGISPQAGIALSSMANLKTQELRALVPPGLEWGDVQESTRQKFQDLLRSFPPDAGGTRTAQAILDSGIRLALYHVKMGSSFNSALELSYQELGTRLYTVHEFRGVPYRIPTGLDAGEVELGANEILRNFSLTSSDVSGASSVLNTEELAEMSSGDIRARGYWMTNPQGSGLRLYLDGAPVTSVNGIVEYTWGELLATGSEYQERVNKIHEENMQRLRREPKY